MRLKCHLLISSLFIMVMMTSCLKDNSYCSERNLFNDSWKFFKVDSFMQINEEQIINGIFPSHAITVVLPHTPHVEPLVVNDQWQGICYYSKTFSIEKNNKHQHFFLKFDGAMNVADIWVNGVHLDKHVGGYLPFTVDITKVVKTDSDYIVVVRLDNRDNPVTGPKPLKELDFNTYGGLYRNAWIIKKAPIYISDPVHADKIGSGGIIFRTKNISEKSATIEIKTHVVNSLNSDKDVTLEYSFQLKNGKQVFSEKVNGRVKADGDKQIDFITQIENPSLWSPDTPNLYILETRLYIDNTLLDKETVQVGIRDINISKKGLYLNGRKTFLRGVNRHQEYPYVGYAIPDEAQFRDAYKIKQAGFDYVRASHYPPSPAFLKACDELGIFVLDAILGWQYFGDSLFVEQCKISAKELIRRDRNHPCILGWELSINETLMPKKFMKEMNRIRTEEAPVTYTAGWIKDEYDIYIEARQHRESIDLDVPLIVSEYGDWEYYAQNAGFNQNEWNNLLLEERNSRQPRESGEHRMLQQATNIQEAHHDNLSTNAFADGYWTMFDYNRGYANNLEYSGVMDINRLPKFSYYFFQSQRSIIDDNRFAKPMIFISSHWTPGTSKSIRVYSNCDEVELYLNDYFVARKRPDSNYATSNLNHPPFTFDIACTAPGILQAYGYYKGQKACSTSISTPEEATQIILWVDTSGVSPKTNDLILVHAKSTDKNGTLIYDPSYSIEFNSEGDGTIINSGPINAVGGIASILVQTGTTPGNITIKAKNAKLKEGRINIKFSGCFNQPFY